MTTFIHLLTTHFFILKTLKTQTELITVIYCFRLLMHGITMKQWYMHFNYLNNTMCFR